MGYILRHVIFENAWKRQLADLIRLCHSADIEEVALMEMSHQIRVSPFLLEKHRRMAAIYQQMAKSFRQEKIVFSVNVATLAGHERMDLRPGNALSTQLYIGDDLRPVPGNYCLLDEQWQEYAVKVCALYASAYPAKLYVDDDFRSMNHTTEFGCFCPIHVAETARRLGRAITAEELVRHIPGGGGADLAARQAWQEATFAGQLRAAGRIQRAVAAVSPETRVGLMNSGECAHAMQGRDMDRLLREFAGAGRRPLSRPSGKAYRDVIHGAVLEMHQVMALSAHAIGSDVQITSEVENWPHSRYNKSMHSTRLQLQLHALAGAEDFTLNLYDYLATPPDMESGFQQLLVEMKEPLAAIQAARRDKQLRGLGIPWRREIATHAFSRRDQIRDVLPKRDLEVFLPQLGVPVQFALGPAHVLIGDNVLCYDNAELRKLLAGGLLLDGTAVENLKACGLGDLTGVNLTGSIDEPTVERLDASEFSGPFGGHLQATSGFRLWRDGLAIHRLEPRAGARSISTLLDEEMQLLAPAMTLFENELGGRVAVTSVPFTPLQCLYRAKSWQIGRVVEWLMPDTLPVLVEDSPNIAPIYYEDAAGEGLLALLNVGLDPMEARLRTRLVLTDFTTGATVVRPELAPLSMRLFRTHR